MHSYSLGLQWQDDTAEKTSSLANVASSEADGSRNLCHGEASSALVLQKWKYQVVMENHSPDKAQAFPSQRTVNTSKVIDC